MELGAYAYRLRRGAPVPSYQLPHDADDDWPLSSAADLIIDARYKMLDGDYDGGISKDMVNVAKAVIDINVGGLKKSDLRARKLRRVRPGIEPVGPTSRYWVRESIEWVEIQYDETVGGDLVREAESEYRQMIEHLKELAEDGPETQDF